MNISSAIEANHVLSMYEFSSASNIARFRLNRMLMRANRPVLNIAFKQKDSVDRKLKVTASIRRLSKNESPIFGRLTLVNFLVEI